MHTQLQQMRSPPRKWTASHMARLSVVKKKKTQPHPSTKQPTPAASSRSSRLGEVKAAECGASQSRPSRRGVRTSTILNIHRDQRPAASCYNKQICVMLQWGLLKCSDACARNYAGDMRQGPKTPSRRPNTQGRPEAWYTWAEPISTSTFSSSVVSPLD